MNRFFPLFSFFIFVLLNTAQAQVNYVLQFDGVNDRVELGTGLGGDLRSIEFWFRASDVLHPGTSLEGVSFVIRDDATQLHEYGVYMRGTEWPDGRGRLYFFMRNNGVLHEVASNADTWTDGVWYHVCGTISPTAGMRFYIDGELQADTDPTGTDAIPLSSEQTCFGSWGPSSFRLLKGRMDEVRFWNRALDQQEIQDRMCYWLDPDNETDLAGYWRMNEGSGAEIQDVSGAGHDGDVFSATFQEGDNCISGFIGMAEEDASHAIAAYPNPWNTTVRFTSDHPLSNAAVNVLNSLGAQVMVVQGVSGFVFDLERNELPAGVYTVIVREANRTLRTQVVVADR